MYIIYQVVACFYRCNVTFYMEDNDGNPLLADDIIPILISEVALGFNDDNPYNLLNAEKGKFSSSWGVPC